MSKKAEILQVDRLTAGYGSREVLTQVTFCLEKGEVLAIVGQNGSGKSTLLKAIGGLVDFRSGRVLYKGEELSPLHPHLLVNKGVSIFLQGGLIIPALTVEEHFMLASRHCNPPLDVKLKKEIFEHFPELSRLKKQRAGNLSGGERQMLSFGILMVQGTDTWLLDEPTAGLAPEMVEFSVTFLKARKRQAGLSMLLVEHNMEVAFRLASSVIVAKNGSLSRKFTADEFLEASFFEKHVYN